MFRLLDVKIRDPEFTYCAVFLLYAYRCFVLSPDDQQLFAQGLLIPGQRPFLRDLGHT